MTYINGEYFNPLSQISWLQSIKLEIETFFIGKGYKSEDEKHFITSK